MKSIVVVSDLFASEVLGGAELTTEALLEKSPLPIVRIKSSQLSLDLLEKHKDSHWVFCNFTQNSPELLFEVARREIVYSVIEYDYKFCSFRSPEIHELNTLSPCDCSSSRLAKIILIYYLKAQNIFWMSLAQKKMTEHYLPKLRTHASSHVLSSIFSQQDLGAIKALNNLNAPKDNVYLILDSQSPIKGTAKCIEKANELGLEHTLVKGLKRHQLLRLMSRSKGIIFLPIGSDTCPRFVIEAKLLQCDLILNDNVQHQEESWFQGSISRCFSYLEKRPEFFWNKILET